MKIAIFTDSYFPQINGVVTQINNLHKILVKQGHRVMIVAPSHEKKSRETERHGSKVLLLPSIALPAYEDYRITPPHSPKVFSELEKFSPDLIHVQTPFSVGWLGLRTGGKLKVPAIGTYHTLIPEFLMYLPIPVLKKTAFAKSLAWKYTALFYNRCFAVTTPTPSMKKELERNGIKKVSVLSNAIDFKSFNASAKKRDYSGKNPKLIYFGRIGFEKNIEVLIFAVKHLAKKFPHISLTITGSGPALKFLKKIVHEENLKKHVRFHKPLAQEKLAQHVAQHDIFITASTIETQGLTILEAMASGMPCIGADFMAIPDSIKEGKNGFLFKAFDFTALASKIEGLLKSSSLRKRLGRNSVKTAEKYSAENAAKATIALYLKTLKTFKKQP